MKTALALLRGVVALLLVGAFLLVQGPSAEQGVSTPVASPELELTADTSQFRAGNIISDDLFFDGNAMSAGDVQAFLVGKGANCVAGENPCLKDYRVNTVDLPADQYCGGYRGAPGETAAAIIAQAGASCGVSQRVLLVVMQKEMGLVRNTGSSVLTNYRYDRAMGFKCPDGRPCDPAFAGLQRQVYFAARQYKVYAANPTGFNFRPGVTREVRFDVETSCGSAPVAIANQATAGLYNYTPYQPNRAALDAGYGSAEPCGAYGNRNFWLYYTDWFGSTQSPGGNAVVTRANEAGAALGSPLTFVSCGLEGGGCFQAFQYGSVYWSPATGARIVKGAILQRWASLGWETGRVGYPAGEEVCGLKGSGCYQLFQNGSMYWSEASGAHAVSGEISRAWSAQKWETGSLGYPTGEEACGLPGGGCYQGFQGGSVYWSPGRGAYPVSGAFLDHWAGTRWEVGVLGYPTGWQTCGLRDSGCYQGFQHGAIYSSATTGVRHLIGEFLTRWGAQGYETGPLGYPTSSTVCGLTGGGCYTAFQTGAVYWSPATGARIVAHGPVATRWADQQWERGPLGYPVADTTCGLRDGGCRQDFSGGTVTWTEATSSRLVGGAQRDRWTALGAQGGALGWPTTEVTCANGGESCTQRFQNGSVVTSTHGGTRAVVGSIAQVWQREIGVLGLPTGDEVCGLPGGGCYQLFRGGAVYRSTAGGTHPVWGAISQAWAQESWERGPLGYPTGPEVCTPVHDSCTQAFQGGVVVWSAAHGAHPIRGAIVGAWTASGGTAGAVGAPHGAEICGLVRGGCYQAFDRGGIYWSPATGAHTVTGAILAAWGRAGWEVGSLGYPAADAQTAGNEVSQRFEGGTLVWNTTSGTVTRR